MARISDIIEQFILKTLGEEDYIDLSRNELAEFFSCVPSQINYVLDTRFTLDRGFTTESVRGGGGYIRLYRIHNENDSYINNLILESIGEELTFKRANQILCRLVDDKVINEHDKNLISASISEGALSMPLSFKDKIRASIFKNVLLYLLKEKESK